MRIAVVGSTNYPKLDKVRVTIVRLKDRYGTELEVISGGAQGVGEHACSCASDYGIPVTEYPIEWEKHPDTPRGRQWALRVRNTALVQAADMVVALWDGESKGTRMAIDLALKYKKHLEVIFP